jgi:hypothetical protein
VAAREQPAGHAGSVFLDIDVPDFSKPALVMAGLVLSAMTARVVPTAGTVPALAGILPGPPTTAREFSVGDTLAVFARISENNPSRPHTIDITTTVRAADGKEMFKVGKPHDAGEVGADAPGYLALIPLGRLPAGAYTLTVSTTSSIDTYVVSRDVPFQIR